MRVIIFYVPPCVSVCVGCRQGSKVERWRAVSRV